MTNISQDSNRGKEPTGYVCMYIKITYINTQTDGVEGMMYFKELAHAVVEAS